MSPQEDMVSVVIYDLSGRIAMKYSSDSSSPVAVMSCDVSELSAGNYCLGILNGHGNDVQNDLCGIGENCFVIRIVCSQKERILFIKFLY